MNVNTLLARQMELHTSVRHPPKTAAELVRFRGQMHHYKTFFTKLKWMSQRLSSEVDTTFQCLMYISLGGVVSFDKQHQDGSVPMHQAKVLARDTAIELEPALRALVPHEELMVYVGASKDLRATLRVKVEDSNDLVTAEKSVNEAVEYLDFIYTESCGDADTMFAFYMVEDERSLNALLDASAQSPLGSSTPGLGSTFSGTVSQRSPVTDAPLEPLPAQGSLVAEVRRLCAHARDPKAKPLDRASAAQTVAQWLSDMPTSTFTAARAALMSALDATVEALVTEKRSTLCRVGCDMVTSVMTHLKDYPQVFAEGESVVAVLGRWVSALCRGIYVTVSAIAMATDSALRDVFTQSHGSVALTKALATAFDRGTQTELRRKCLAYMSLSVCAGSGDRRTLTQLARLLIPISQRYITVGDSPSRKMARALVAVLRVVTGEAVPLEDAKTERLVEAELGRIQAVVDEGPRALSQFLFESDNFVSSMKRPAVGASSGLTSPVNRPFVVPPAAAHSGPSKHPRISPIDATGTQPDPSAGPAPRDRKSRTEAGAVHGTKRPSAAHTTEVYETNDSLVARRWSADVESEPGLSYPSLSVSRMVGQDPAAVIPSAHGGRNRTSGALLTVPASASSGAGGAMTEHGSAGPLQRTPPTRKPAGYGDAAMGSTSDGAVGGASLPRMSPSLQRKIAQTRPKAPLD